MAGSPLFVATPLAPTRGIVESFDDPRGIGVIRANGGAGYGFHCTSIAGEGRTIAEGVEVTFTVVPGRHGQWEASGIHPAGSAG